jgi:hypothetical protein
MKMNVFLVFLSTYVPLELEGINVRGHLLKSKTC